MSVTCANCKYERPGNYKGNDTSCPLCHTPYPGSPVHPALEPQQSATKACPFCAETIQRTAVRCRYCGSEIESVIEPPRVQGAANQTSRFKCNSIRDDIENAKPIVKAALAMTVVMVVSAVGWLGYALLDLRKADTERFKRADAAQKVINETSPEAKRLWKDIGKGVAVDSVGGSATSEQLQERRATLEQAMKYGTAEVNKILLLTRPGPQDSDQQP